MAFVQSFAVAQNPLLVPVAAHLGEFLHVAAVVAPATAAAEVAAVAMAVAAAMAAAAHALALTGNHYNCTWR